MKWQLPRFAGGGDRGDPSRAIFATLIASLIAALASGYGAYMSARSAKLSGGVQERIAESQQKTAQTIAELEQSTARKAAESAKGSQMIDYALKVLQNKDTKDDRRLRKWAIDSINEYSPVKIPPEIGNDLVSGIYTLSPTEMDSLAPPSEFFRFDYQQKCDPKTGNGCAMVLAPNPPEPQESMRKKEIRM